MHESEATLQPGEAEAVLAETCLLSTDCMALSQSLPLPVLCRPLTRLKGNLHQVPAAALAPPQISRGGVFIDRVISFSKWLDNDIFPVL